MTPGRTRNSGNTKTQLKDLGRKYFGFAAHEMEHMFAAMSAMNLAAGFEVQTTPSGASVIGVACTTHSSSEASPASSSTAVPNKPIGAGAGPSPAKAYKKSELDLEQRFALCRSVGEECIQVRTGYDWRVELEILHATFCSLTVAVT